MTRWVQRWRETVDYLKVRNRLRKSTTVVVTDWAESTLWATQQGIEGLRVTNDAAALEEVRRGVVALVAAVDVLQERQET